MRRKHYDLKLRPVNDKEYNAINDFLRKDYYRHVDLGGYEDQDRSEIYVYDITDDFKIINVNTCTVWLGDKPYVQWDLYRYAYKYGLIYPYDEDDDRDDCEEDIDELFKTN